MSSLTTVRPTSKSQRSDDRRLASEVLPRESLTTADRRQMYDLLEAYFDNTSFRRFTDDLEEKDTVILIRDYQEGRLAGFSTLMRLDVEVMGQRAVGFFSGDTVVAREYWGVASLGRSWSKIVFTAADRIQLLSPGTPVYWFLICSGYKTWRYLPVCFRNYLPHPTFRASDFDRQVLDALAAKKFPNEYDPKSGVIRLGQANPLRQGVAAVTDQRLRDPLIEFFVQMNPGHANGDELACLVPIARSNLTPAGERLLRAEI